MSERSQIVSNEDQLDLNLYGRVVKVETELKHAYDSTERILGSLDALTKEFRDFKEKVHPIMSLQSRLEHVERTVATMSAANNAVANQVKGGWKLGAALFGAGMGALGALDIVLRILHK